jgi:hypothetical protein
VINLGEILNTPRPERLTQLAHTINDLLPPKKPVLDHPDRLLKSAALQWRSKEPKITVRESSAGRVLREFLRTPNHVSASDRNLVKHWIQAMNDDHENFLRDIRPEKPIIEECLPDPTWLRDQRFMATFSRVPPAATMKFSPTDLASLCEGCDAWAAFRAGLAYTIDLAFSHAPKAKKIDGRRTRRPGGADMRQAVYLGFCETFIIEDGWLREAMTRISNLLPWPRPVLTLDTFLALDN